MMGQLVSGLLFGGIGFVAFTYGKRQASFKAMLIGVLLMVYPYFVANMLAAFAIGILLTAALFIFRD